MTTSIPRRPMHPLTRLDPSPTTTAISYPRSTTDSSGSGTRCSRRPRVIVLLNRSLGSKKSNPTSMWHITMCAHVAIIATMHAMTAPPDRTGTQAEVAETTHVIVDGTRDVIGGMTAVIMEVTKVTGTTVEILPLAVG